MKKSPFLLVVTKLEVFVPNAKHRSMQSVSRVPDREMHIALILKLRLMWEHRLHEWKDKDITCSLGPEQSCPLRLDQYFNISTISMEAQSTTCYYKT